MSGLPDNAIWYYQEYLTSFGRLPSMGWEHSLGDRGSEWHEGHMAAEFEDGYRALGIAAPAFRLDISPSTSMATAHSARKPVRRHGGEAAFQTRPAGDVIGWRIVCNCYAPGD